MNINFQIWYEIINTFNFFENMNIQFLSSPNFLQNM